MAVMVLVPQMSNSMDRFKEEQTEKSALVKGVTVTDFVKDMVTTFRLGKCDTAIGKHRSSQGRLGSMQSLFALKNMLLGIIV